MIRIRKPAPPDILLVRGAEAAQRHCDEYDAAPADYRSGAKTFDFDRAIYAAAEVKDALRAAQHRKCAFCESLFDHSGYGDVEHFRPKAGYKPRDADPLKRPGYYWLAYDWANLFLSCQLCNQQFKRNLFPLRDGRRRARSHRQSIANEQPLLIDPAGQDPSSYIGFHEEYAFPVGDCREGAATIAAVGLNREQLAENRRRRLEDLKRLVQVCELLRELVKQGATPELSARLEVHGGELRSRRGDVSEYAAMIRAFLAG